MKFNKDKNKSKDKKKFGGSKVSIAFYVLAVLFLLYGAYMIYTVYEYLVSYYAGYGLKMWDNVGDNIQYFVSNCSAYFVYAVICYGIGAILQTLQSMKMSLSVKEEIAFDEEVDEEEEAVLVEDTTIEYNSEEKLA